jgi:hypothetical protein
MNKKDVALMAQMDKNKADAAEKKARCSFLN